MSASLVAHALVRAASRLISTPRPLNLTLIAFLACTAQTPPLRLFESVEPHMGTLISIKLYTTNQARAKAAFTKAFDRIAELDQILSDYREDSELNQLCRATPGHPIKISNDLYNVLTAAQQLAKETSGAFDVTQGPVILLWRQARRDRLLPDPAALNAASARSGFRKLHVNKTTAMLDQANMQLDLGGIAKGYAADAALEVLARLGIASALVAMSGDLAFSHAPPGQRGWRIDVDDRVLELSDAAVSTSGDAEQFVELNGKRYSHIIDPATAQALTNGITVSVIARRGITADSLATAACILARDRGMALVAKFHAKMLVWKPN